MRPAVNPNTGQAATRPDALIVSQSQQIPVNPIERVMPFLIANMVICAEAY